MVIVPFPHAGMPCFSCWRWLRWWREGPKAGRSGGLRVGVYGVAAVRAPQPHQPAGENRIVFSIFSPNK